MEYALVILLLAVPGLVVRRGGPGMARFAAFVALLAIGFAALDLTREILTPVRSMVVVIPTASLSESSADSLRKGLGAAVNVRFEPGRATLDHRIGRATALVQRKTPLRFRLITACQSSVFMRISSPSRVMPALLTSTSILPLRSITVLIRPFTASSSATLA